MFGKNILLFFSIFLNLNIGIGSLKARNELLHMGLFEDFYRSIPFPSSGNQTGPVVVEVSVHVIGIELENPETLKWNFYLRMHWKDHRLKFQESPDRSDEPVNLIDRGNLWIPDLFIPNAKEAKLQHLFTPNSMIRIHKDGSIIASNRFIVATRCKFHRMRFPKDKMFCNMELESYAYSTRDLVIRFKEPRPESLSNRYRGTLCCVGDFRFVNASSFQVMMSTSTGNYSRLNFGLEFERWSGRYKSVQIPCIMFVIVSLLNHLISKDLLTARLLLTLSSLMMLTLYSLYINSKFEVFLIVTPMDYFTGCSFLIVFLDLLQIVFETLFIQRSKEKTKSGEAGEEDAKMGALKKCLCVSSRLVLPCLYLVFIIGYFSIFKY